MLESMRNSLRSPIAIAFMLLIVLSFVVWGTGDIFRGGTGDAVVVVGPEKVTVEEFAAAWNREINYRIRTSNGQFSETDAKAQGLDEQLLQRMVSEAALSAKQDELGIGVSARMIFEYAAGYEAFKDPFTGNFSDEQYVQTLAQAELTPKLFEAEARADMGRQQVLSAVIEGVISPISYTRNMMNFLNETRKVESIFVPTAIIPPSPEPTQEQLEQILSENPGQFAVPERRAATIVLISATDLELDIAPTEDELRNAYDFRKSEFSTTETRSWVQIMVDDQITAETVAQRLNAGETAIDIIADLELSGTPIELSDANISSSPDDQIAEVVFAANDGETGTAEGRFKWAAWKLNAITPGTEQSFEEVAEQLKTEFIRQEARNRLYEIMGDFEGERARGASLTEAAETHQLVAISLPPAAQNNSDENLQAIQLYQTYPEMLNILFELDELVESNIEETEHGDFYALSVDQIIPTTQPELAQITDIVRAAWLANANIKAIQEVAETIKTSLETGVETAQFLTAYPGSSIEIAILSRYEPEPSLPPALARQLFELAPGEVFFALSNAGDQLVVSRLQSVIPPSAVDDETLRVLSGRLDRELAQDLENQFISGLRAAYTIRQDARLRALALGEDG